MLNNMDVVLSRFRQYISDYIIALSMKKDKLSTTINSLKKINSLNDKSSISEIVSLQDQILEINPKLENDLKILEFFSSNNMLNLPQVNAAYSHIISSLDNNNKQVIEDYENKLKAISASINECQKFINNEEFNYQLIIELLENSSLSEEEIITVLTYFAYNISAKGKQIEEKPVVSIEPIVEEHDQSKYLEYYALLDKVNNIIIMNYNLLANKGPAELKDIINVSQMIGGMNISDIFSFYSEKQVYEGSIYKLKSLKTELEEELNKKDVNQEYIDELAAEINSIITFVNDVSLDQVTDMGDNVDFSDVLFLLDDNGVPVFNYEYDKNDMEKISSLLMKIASVSKNPSRDNTRVVQDSWLDANKIKACVKFFSDMACSYIRVHGNKLLVIDFAPNSFVYGETKNIIKKYFNRIDEINQLLKNGNQEFIKMEQDFLEGFKSSLNGVSR